MSIIQDIRDKYARVSVIAIALALIGFILTDYFSGKNKAQRGARSNTIGSVNGQKIDGEEFKKLLDQTKDGLKQQGYSAAMADDQALNQAWNQKINLILLEDEFDKLGLQIGKKELGDILYGPNAPEDIKNAGTDEQTGKYDPIRARQAVDQMMKSKSVPQSRKDQFKESVNQQILQRKYAKYMSLFTNSVNFPRWFVEKQTADNSLLGKISMVKVFYTDSSFVDSTIKISDKEIEDYVNKHKQDYKQDESRSIYYASFNAAPTASDSAAIRNQVASKKAEFDTTKDLTTFLAINQSPEYENGFKHANQLPATAKDSIIKLPVGGVYGPYLDGVNYSLAKLMVSQSIPDSVKARHILIKTYDPQKQRQLMEDSVGKKKIDSIDAFLKAGVSFDSLARKFSDDGSGANGGDLGYFAQGRMVKEFNDFCFEHKKGERQIVKTVFGYHIIEILDQKNFGPQYKVAYLSKEIVSSQETDDSAQLAANNFAAEVKDLKTFDAAVVKILKPIGADKGVASNIKRIDAQVPGLGSSRSFVRNVYLAKNGEMIKPERIENKYVVAIVTDIFKEGTMPVAKARPTAERALRNRKKAEMMRQKAGKITTLEAASAALGKPIETIDSLRMKTAPPQAKFGYEPVVYGATFNPANKDKVVPEMLEGLNGVYVIRVDNVSATSAAAGSVEDQRKQMLQQAKQSGGNQTESMLLEALKKAATIKDKRADIY